MNVKTLTTLGKIANSSAAKLHKKLEPQIKLANYYKNLSIPLDEATIKQMQTIESFSPLFLKLIKQNKDIIENIQSNPIFYNFWKEALSVSNEPIKSSKKDNVSNELIELPEKVNVSNKSINTSEKDFENLKIDLNNFQEKTENIDSLEIDKMVTNIKERSELKFTNEKDLKDAISFFIASSDSEDKKISNISKNILNFILDLPGIKVPQALGYYIGFIYLFRDLYMYFKK
ncbi:hypothetical protein [Fusobacterium ulcerans]|uniref:hypothetical protein n=1 Tax=Fusobacterium ulcerans TaxID=861 RepID=UPI0027BABC4D|nr:hypothetical protein [Fusobacterium ulcerans]